MAISGIRSVDFMIQAVGEGVVNHNGSFTVYNPMAGKAVDNHLFPKLRGVDPLQKATQEIDGRKVPMSIRLDSSAFASATLIVSGACIRAGIFKDVSFGLREVTPDNVERVLASLHGLVRGYLITQNGRNMARKSPLYVTDFECIDPGLVFSQGSNSRTRGTANEDTSIYSYFATGKDLQYTGMASLSIEDLQYIPLENSLGRSSFDFQITSAQGKQVAESITKYLSLLALSDEYPEARFLKQSRRVGGIEPIGDAGVLLNDDAIRIVAREIHALIENLTIRQGKGYLTVTQVDVDYNDSPKVFRSKSDESLANPSSTGTFACYYAEQDLSDDAFDTQQKQLEAEANDRKKKAAKPKSKKTSSAKQHSTNDMTSSTDDD